jgi:hypothetical protein
MRKSCVEPVYNRRAYRVDLEPVGALLSIFLTGWKPVLHKTRVPHHDEAAQPVIYHYKLSLCFNLPLMKPRRRIPTAAFAVETLDPTCAARSSS